jgi:thiaminase
VIGVAGEMADGLGPPGRALAHQHFRTTIRYEPVFWDMGCQREGRPG